MASAMIPLRDDQTRKAVPIVCWTLVALFVVVALWDRGFDVRSPSMHFADLAMRPREVWATIRGAGNPFSLVTLYTSMFMHGTAWHLIGNCIFLLVFGSTMEEAMGSWRFALYYLGWGMAASMVQIFVDTRSLTPTLGASGAIGGVMGAYFLLFPANKIRVSVPILAFSLFTVPAWVILGLWFAYQLLIPQENVANWAHAGGFLAGMLTILGMGGRRVVLGDPLSDTIVLKETNF